jgi:hypothetical protein
MLAAAPPPTAEDVLLELSRKVDEALTILKNGHH